jgi:hypothetical protein
MNKLKYKKKKKNFHNSKISKNQLLMYSGRGGRISKSRGQAVELNQTVSRQCTYAVAEYVSG